MEHAASLTELASAKCSSVKYDVELVEEYFARQVCYGQNWIGGTWLLAQPWTPLISVLAVVQDLVILQHRLHHHLAAP